MFPRFTSSTIRIWIFRLLLVAAACWASGYLAIWAVESMRPIPLVEEPSFLQVRPESLDFGDVVETTDFRHDVPVRNTSAHPMSVRFEKSCDCTGIEPEVLRLGACETGTLTLRLDLLHNRSRFAGRLRRPFVAHLEASWGDRAGDRLPLEVHGTVRAVLEVWPPNLHLRDDLVVGEDGAEEQIDLKPCLSLGGCVVKESPANIQAWTRRTATGFRLFVRPKAGLPVGRFENTIVLKVSDAQGKDLPARPIPVSGAVTGRFVSVPHEGSFGMHPVGFVLEETVFLRGRLPGRFSVVKADADHPAVRVEALGSLAGEISYRVRWRIGRPGDQRANITFVVRDDRANEHRVGFEVRCYGTSIE